jgi:cellobiose phosphorylase
MKASNVVKGQAAGSVKYVKSFNNFMEYKNMIEITSTARIRICFHVKSRAVALDFRRRKLISLEPKK